MKPVYALIAAVMIGCGTSDPPLRDVPPCPVPCKPDKKPRPRRPWDTLAKASVEASVGGPVNEDGTEISCDLPGSHHVRNRGGSDGAGLCVFASCRHAGDWQADPVFYGLFEYMFKHPGGGYPSKVDAVIERYCKERGLPKPDYIQVESNDLEILKAACRSGLMPGVTYSFSPTGRYGGGRISHMVSLVHADDNWFVILDNNYPGENAYEWMTPKEFMRTYSGGRTGWAVIPLAKSPPPAPRSSNG